MKLRFTVTLFSLFLFTSGANAEVIAGPLAELAAAADSTGDLVEVDASASQVYYFTFVVRGPDRLQEGHILRTRCTAEPYNLANCQADPLQADYVETWNRYGGGGSRSVPCGC